MNHTISDQELRQAVIEACEVENAYWEENVSGKSHVFSKEHNRKIRKLHKQYLKMHKTSKTKIVEAEETKDVSQIAEGTEATEITRYRHARPRLRYLLAAVLIAALMCGTAFAIEPIREKMYDMIENLFDDHTDITYQEIQKELQEDTAQSEATKTQPFQARKLIWVPSGYTMTGEEEDRDYKMYSVTYEDKKTRSLSYIQSVIEHFDFSITSDGTPAEKIELDGRETYWLVDSDGYRSVLYEEDGYIYMYGCQATKSQMKKLIRRNLKNI